MILATDRPVPAIRIALNHPSIVALGSCRGATYTYARTERNRIPTAHEATDTAKMNPTL